MATQEIEKLIVSLEASTKKYEQALAKAQGTTVSRLRKMEKEAENFATRFDRKLSAIGGSLKSFGAGLVAGLGAEQLARAAATAIKSIADIGDQAKKLGLSNGEFQTLKLGAQLAGVEVEALASGMKKLGVNSSDAIRGQGSFGEILKANNISLTDANGKMKSQVEILGIVANLVSNAANEQDGLAIAQAALGKSGTELMGLLEQGASGVQEAMRQAKEAGVQFTDQQIAKAQEFDDKIDMLIEKISVGMKGAFIDAAIEVEGFSNRAIAALDQVGLKAESVGAALVNALLYNPALPSMSIGSLASKAGQAAIGAVNPATNIPLAVSGPGKGDLPGVKSTFMPEDPAVVAERKRLAAEKEAEALRKLKELEREREQARKVAERERLAFQDKWREAEFNMAEQASQRIYDQQQAMRDSMTQLAELGYSAMESLISGGEKAKDVVLNLAKSLASAAVQAALLGQGPLAGFFGGGSGAGGLFGKLIGGMFGGGAPVSLYHKGGIAGHSSGMSRMVNPAMFANAPRYHSGGVAGLKSGEVPAVLQKGEVILPKGQGMGGNAMKVEINNYGAKVQTSRRDDGGLRIDVEAAVSSVIAKGGADKALRGRFNVSPGRTTR